MDYKERVKQAIINHAKKNMPKTPRKTKNQSPEKLVQNECLHWLRLQGFDVYVIESKATYSQASQSYRSSSAMPGFSDIVGCDNNGMFLAIELKARGRLSTLKNHQRKFLVEKINRGGFAACVDSVDLLKSIYQKWSILAGEPSKSFLLNCLPKEKLEDSPNAPLFDLQE